MMKRRLQCIGAAMALAMALATVGPTPADGVSRIQWYDYQEGTRLAKMENKKVFLFFWSEWCRYCDQMEEETFVVPDVVAYLNTHFVAVKVNSETETAIASRYFVRGVPTAYFLNESGDRIGSRPGFLPPDLLLSILRYMHTNSYREMSFRQFTSQ